jgi:hypothetical protein
MTVYCPLSVSIFAGIRGGAGYSWIVATRQTRSRRLATALRWPVGVTLTAWRYLWRTTPIYREEVASDWSDFRTDAVADGGKGVQALEEGQGDMFRRRYRTRIEAARCSAAELIDIVAADPDGVAPSEFATFQKTRGAEDAMTVGDEYVVRMVGPWDGPVRVSEREPQSFKLLTLDGHLEAGQIEFRAAERDDQIVFEIESLARSRDRLTDFLYDRLRISKEVQLHMWTSTLERVVKLSGGTMVNGIEIHTRKLELSRDGS